MASRECDREPSRTLPQFVDTTSYAPVFETDWFDGQDELRFRLRELAPGEYLFMPGERHEFFYHVASGMVRLDLMSTEGTVKSFFYHAPGTEFGFMWLRDDGLAVSCAVATRPSVVYAIDHRDLIEYFDKDPERHLAFTKYLFQITNSQTREIASMSFQTGFRRLAELLCVLAEESLRAGSGSAARTGVVCGGEADVVIPYTIDELAQIIGTHRNTVSNSLARLRDLGLVARQPRPIAVSNLAGLRAYVQER